MKFITLDNAAGIFNGYISKRFKTHSAAAEYYGVSKQYVSQCKSGERPLNKQMLEDVGIKKVKGYVNIA